MREEGRGRKTEREVGREQEEGGGGGCRKRQGEISEVEGHARRGTEVEVEKEM